MLHIRHRRSAVAAGAAAAVLIGGTIAVVAAPGAGAQSLTYQHLTAMQKRLVSGALLEELGPQPAARAASVGAPAAALPPNYAPGPRNTCPVTTGGNVKVNQNCLNLSDVNLQGRSQAQNETWAAADPNNPSRVVASYNDYRRGDGTCGVSLSSDGGRTWGDSTVPNGFTPGFPGAARQYWQAGGDTSVAFDSRGNAYLSCQMFNRGAPVTQDADQSSGFFVFRSTGNGGASWNFAGRPAYQYQSTGATLVDKALMAVDADASSPFRDRVYVTYTLFAADGTAYIYAVSSADHGETFSAPVLVSRNSRLCSNTYGLPTPNGNCNENQFSEPFTGPDGALYVVWANFNNATAHGIPGDAATKPNENYNQMLLAKSTNGGRSFGQPVLVSRYYDLPDCATYTGQDAGRGCIPVSGAAQNSYFRAVNYPYGAVNPTNPGQVVVTFGSYINRNSNEATGCTPDGFSPTTGINLFVGVGTACNNDILMSVSTDGGASFAGSTVDPRRLPSVGSTPAQARSDQFWQAETFTPSGTLAVAYYDRQYGNSQASGYSDITLSGSADLVTFGQARVTSSSMPPPTQFSGLFLGDYIGMTAAGESVLPIWTDTRSEDLFACTSTGVPTVCGGSAPNAPYANDQDAFTRAMAVPTR